MRNKTFMTDGNYSIEKSWGNFGTGTFEVTLLDGGYHGKLLVKYGGNCYGSSLIHEVAGLFEEEEFKPDMTVAENEKHAVIDGDGYFIGVVLYTADGSTLMIDDWDAFRHAVVGITMVDYQVTK